MGAPTSRRAFFRVASRSLAVATATVCSSPAAQAAGTTMTTAARTTTTEA